MRRPTLALMLPVICMVLPAESTGRIAGQVQNKAGVAIPGAKITLKRLDRNWTKELVSDKNGGFLQVGLEPQEFEFTVSALGYTEQKSMVKIPLGDVIKKVVIMLTMEETRAAAIASGALKATAVEDPGAALNAEGRDAFNLAIPLYNESKFGEALPLVEKAHKALLEAVGKMKDEKEKAELGPELLKVERVLGICTAQAGTATDAALPYLLKALERNPKDQPVIAGLIAASKAKGDTAGEQKYTALLETLTGPNPDTIYNKGVEAFNNGNTKEAKVQFLKTLQVAPTYAEAHFLLAMVEFGDNNLRGTKQNLEKYVELAPKGKNADTAREMLKDPSLKKVK